VRFHVISLLLGFPALLWLGRDMWFQRDEWPFLLGHVDGARPLDYLAPYDIHWETVTKLVYRGLGATVGARTYLPYVSLSIALHLVVAHLLWRVMRRCGSGEWVAGGVVAVFLVLGAGSEAMFWAFSISYLLPLSFGLGTVLLATTTRPLTWRRIGAIWGLAVLGLMSSGVGIAMIVLPAVCVAVREGLRRAAVVVAVPAVVYLTWLLSTGATILHQPGGESAQTRGEIPGFVWTGMRSSAAALVGADWLAAAALAALLAWGVWRAWTRQLPAAVPACACGAVADFLLTAFGRVNGGDPTTSRYLYVGAALLLPAVALALTDLVRMRLPLTAIAAAGAVVAMFGQSTAVLVARAADLTAQTQRSRQFILAAVSLSDDTGALPLSLPDPGLGFLLPEEDALLLRVRGDLQPLRHVPAAVLAEATRRVHVEVSTDTAVPDTGAAPEVSGSGRGAMLRSDGSCAVARGWTGEAFTLRATFPAAGSLRIDATSPVIVTVYLGGSLAMPQDLAFNAFVVPGSPRYVDDTLPGSAVILRISPGTVRLCP
jgi:hypothetical protein